MNLVTNLKREIASQLNLKTIRWPFKTCARALIIDNEEIAVRPIDVPQSHVND